MDVSKIPTDTLWKYGKLFNNMDEFKKYVHVALSQCTDSAERQACMTIINSMFING